MTKLTNRQLDKIQRHVHAFRHGLERPTGRRYVAGGQGSRRAGRKVRFTARARFAQWRNTAG